MSIKRSAILAAVLAASLYSVGAAPPASARPIGFGIRVDVAPPPIRREVVVVRPGAGYFWVPGHWDWAPARRNYVWVGGVWARPPFRHAIWVGPRWRHYGGRAYFARGHWRH